MTSQISLPKGFVLDITQKENGSTGYLFDVDAVNASGIVNITKHPLPMPPSDEIVFGASHPVRFRIEALKEGKVNFACLQPWAKENVASNIEIIVT